MSNIDPADELTNVNEATPDETTSKNTSNWPEIFGAGMVIFVIWLILTQTG